MNSFVYCFRTNVIVFIPESAMALRDHISCASATVLLLLLLMPLYRALPFTIYNPISSYKCNVCILQPAI